MSIGLTPIQLIVLSGLLQDKGLRLPLALTDRIDRLRDTSTLFGRLSYIARHPQNNANMTAVKTAMQDSLPGMAGVVPSSYTANLAEGIRTYDVVGSIRARAENLLGNGLKGVLENLVICNGVLQNSFNVQASLYTYQNAKFSDLYLNANNYTDVVSHGLTSTFGSSAKGTPASLKATTNNRTVTAKEIRNSLTSLSSAIEKLGELYDWSELTTVGTAHGLIKNIYKIGAAYNTEINNLMITYGYNVDTISTSDNLGLTQLLQQITSKDITVILKTANATTPDVKLINTGADLLDAVKVLPVDVADMLPNKDLSQLGKKLISLGVTNGDITAILNSLTGITIPELPYLNQLTKPIPATDAEVLNRTLITGTGKFNNATLDDLLGALSGNSYFGFLDDIIHANSYFTKQNAVLLMAAADDIVTTLAADGTVSTEQKDTFQTAVDDFSTALRDSRKNTNGDFVQVWPAYSAAENAVNGIITQLTREISNGELAGITINANVEVTTTSTVIDSFDIRNIRRAKYDISVQNNDKIDDFEVKVVHNGTVANIAVYNQVFVGTATALGTVNAGIDANTCTITYTTVTDNQYHHYLRSSVDYTVIGDGSSPDTLVGTNAELSTIYQLDEIALDTKHTGIGTLLERMASDDIYGEAILASLETSRNTKKLETIGIVEHRADPLEKLTEVLAEQGHGLTDSQKRQILITSKADGTDPNVAIANASRHGFFSDYYSRKGNFG